MDYVTALDMMPVTYLGKGDSLFRRPRLYEELSTMRNRASNDVVDEGVRHGSLSLFPFLTLTTRTSFRVTLLTRYPFVQTYLASQHLDYLSHNAWLYYY